MMTAVLHVVAGPYRHAKAYAARQGWPQDSYVIVTRGHQLAGLDPALIVSVVAVKLRSLGARVATELFDEMSRLTALWPTIPVTAAP